MFQPPLDADRHLSGKSVPASENGRANYSREAGVDQCLAAYDHEATIELGISAGMMNAINVTPSHWFVDLDF
jgi:hypothetical protein